MIVIIDNYDSFTYNLFQYICELTDEPVRVFRNDRVSVDDLQSLNPTRIVISPGPGRPEEAGCSVDVVRHFYKKVPILGVCLGHQAVGYAFGGKIVKAKRIVHGKVEDITLDGRGLFRNIPSPARFTRYHSLVVEASLPSELQQTATSRDGEVMGVRHPEYPLEGIQFHPESVSSEYGKKILKNFLNYHIEPFHLPDILAGLVGGTDLSRQDAESFMEELTEGDLTDAQIAAFLVALNCKGVTAQEIAGFASVLTKKRRVIKSPKPVLDTCGTGGDGRGTFNISSMSALVAASCGATVAKHGNRGVSSKSGSADFYRELGVPVELAPEKAEQMLERVGFTFLFAPIYHGSMRHAAPVRRQLGIKTVMNMLGPLVNPVGSTYQLIGVFDPELCRNEAQAARLLGVQRVMVVHGEDGLDEISVCAPTKFVEIDEQDNPREFTLEPEELGTSRFSLEELKGGTPSENAEIARRMLDGTGNDALREAVCVNAGAALYLCGLADQISAGCRQAREAFESGKVVEKLEEIRRVGRQLAEA